MLAVRGDVEPVPLLGDGAGLKQGLGRVELQLGIGCADGNRHQASGLGEVKKFGAVAAPAGHAAARVGELIPLVSAGRKAVEELGIDLCTARFIGLVGEPLSVRRKRAEVFLRDGFHHRPRAPFGERIGPDVMAGTLVGGIEDEPTAVAAPVGGIFLKGVLE